MKKLEPKSDVLLLLPNVLRAIAPLCATDSDGDRPASEKYSDTTAVKMSVTDGTVTFSSTDGRYAGILKGEAIVAVPDKFPNVEACVPKGKPLATCRVDPVRLGQLLLCAADVVECSNDHGVTLELHAEMIVVRAERPAFGETVVAAEFTGLLVPLIKKLDE